MPRKGLGLAKIVYKGSKERREYSYYDICYRCKVEASIRDSRQQRIREALCSSLIRSAVCVWPQIYSIFYTHLILHSVAPLLLDLSVILLCSFVVELFCPDCLRNVGTSRNPFLLQETLFQMAVSLHSLMRKMNC